MIINIDPKKSPMNKSAAKALMMSLAKQVSKPSIGSFKSKNLDPEDLIDILIRYDTSSNLDYDLRVLIQDYEDLLSRSLLLKILIYYDIWDVTKWVLS